MLFTNEEKLGEKSTFIPRREKETEREIDWSIYLCLSQGYEAHKVTQ